MTLLQHYQLSLILIAAVAMPLGLWVYVKRLHNRAARVFCLYSMGIGIWSLSQMLAGSSSDPGKSLFWARVMFHVVIAFPVMLIHFFSALLGIDRRKICRVGWVLVAAFLPFLSSDLFLHSGQSLGFLRSLPRSGPLFLPYNLVWFGWVTYALSLLVRYRSAESSFTREQRNLLLGAFLLGYVTGCVNYLYFYGICVPPLQPFACYGVPIAWLTIAYTVFAYGLFDIHVVIRKSLIYSILITVLTIGYFGIIYLAEWTFQTTIGYQSIGISMVAFATMAVVFQPLRARIQRMVERLFFGASREELVKRLEQLEEQVRQAEKLRAIAILAAGMAHEIKNPLTSIKTFTEYFPEKVNDAVFRKKFHRILTMEVQKIELIVRRLLDFSKPAKLQLQPLRLSEVLHDTLELLSHECLRRGITIERSYTSEEVIAGDAQQLRQAFLNLLLNSLEAMDRGGMLTVSLIEDEGWLRVTIEDTGKGISKSDLQRIWEPLFTTKANGTGLGLSIVRDIVKDHGGTIVFDSHLGLGTRCTLKFPLVPPPAPQHEKPTEIATSSKSLKGEEV